VWPAADRRQDFTRAIESYQLAASDVNGIFFPVASAWLAAWRRDASLALYGDGLHASVAGSYLAGLVMYCRILGKTPVGLPSTLVLRSGTRVSVDASVSALLQAAAAEVCVA